MKTIALVGVSGSGKTTLCNALLNDMKNCYVLEESTRGDILKYCELPFSFNPKFDSTSKILKYDLGRCEYQLLTEQKFIQTSDVDIGLIDKAIPTLLMYVLTMHPRNLENDSINELVSEMLDHCRQMYDLIVYCPYVQFNTKSDGLDRNFTNHYLLEIQDAALRRILFNWLDKDLIVNMHDYSRRMRLNMVRARIDMLDSKQVI